MKRLKMLINIFKINNTKAALELVEEFVVFAGFIMVAKGLYMIYTPLMWIICGLWLMIPAKKVK